MSNKKRPRWWIVKEPWDAPTIWNVYKLGDDDEFGFVADFPSGAEAIAAFAAGGR
ncbi:hypothetical protein [Mycobacteroides abscessus]|uniref:hypothetical protein n=1 Tax=Mycobacteroides abscessus TaxID=36809 RepID=UPI0013F652EC|nr:hypothetical protein [Mycobacteroides abscessus]